MCPGVTFKIFRMWNISPNNYLFLWYHSLLVKLETLIIKLSKSNKIWLSFSFTSNFWVRTGHGTTDWFQIGKGVRQGCILSPCLFNLYAEYIMRNAGLDEAQTGIKIAGRNINNLRYADDTTFMAESKELKSLLMKVKEWKSWLKAQHSEN